MLQYKLYNIRSTLTNIYYIGITKKDLDDRLKQHIFLSDNGRRSPLYDAIRKYGKSNFYICLVNSFNTWKECCKAEKNAIKEARKCSDDIFNIANGGEGGFCVPTNKINSWKNKLCKARAGRAPFKGKSHTKRTREICRNASIQYWEGIPTYNPQEVLSFSFREANKKFGISKTHYYRLKNKNNDRSNKTTRSHTTNF